MVNFESLCDELEQLGYSALQDTPVLWKFFKQGMGGVFKTIKVHADGTIWLSASVHGKAVPFLIVKEDWKLLNVLENVQEVL